MSVIGRGSFERWMISSPPPPPDEGGGGRAEGGGSGRDAGREQICSDG